MGAEGSAFLRKVLKAPKTAQRRLSTHSMKSTLMSWTSKFGLPDNGRSVLARHVSSVTSATAVYSRDMLSPVLRQLDVMLMAIRSGAFCPDRLRSGMMTPAATAMAAPMTPYVGHPPMVASAHNLAEAHGVPAGTHTSDACCCSEPSQ